MFSFVKRDAQDIFNKPILGFLFKNKHFIVTLRIAVTLLFFYALLYGFLHSTKENLFTSAVFWGVFWALFMVVTLPTFGRVFCGICPHGFLGKYITKFGRKKTMPKWMQNRYIGIMILVLGWWGIYYTFDGFWKSPFNTAMMFGVLTLFSFVLYYLYKDMSYCKYICPIGTLTRAYDKLSFTKLETYTDQCKECRSFECADACPYALKPFTFAKKNQSDDCTLCMECAHACEAVKFSFTKPAQQLGEKLKILPAEVWTYILIFASIPVSMGFAHALNRSAIADGLPWNKTAMILGLEEYAGGFAFLYALFFSIFFAVLGLYLASKVLQKEYKTVFTTLGVAFIPLFIFASLGHTLESFFLRGYEKIVEGFAQGFGIAADVDSLAKRGDGWLHYFSLFKWIGVVWAFLLLYKRMKLIESSKMRKLLGYFFASFMILFYIALNLFIAYAFSMGKESHRGMGGFAKHKKADLSTHLQAHQNFTPLYFSLDDPTQKFAKKRSHMGMGRPKDPKAVPTKELWLVHGDLGHKYFYNAQGLQLFAYDYEGRAIELQQMRKKGQKLYSFEVPHNGYYNLYAIDTQTEGYYKVAKLEYLHGKHGNEDRYTEAVKKQLLQHSSAIDLVRIKSEEEESFFHRLKMGDTLAFVALFDKEPLVGAKVKLSLASGWSKEFTTNTNGEISFRLIRDYFPEWSAFDKRFKQELLLELSYEKEGTEYLLTYPAFYYPNQSDYESYGYALILIIFTLLISGVIVYRFRANRSKVFVEEKLSE